VERKLSLALILLVFGALLRLAVACTGPEVTPTEVIPTATVVTCEALGTRVAQMEATVVVWETVMPEVMQTAAALYEWSLTPTPGACPPTPTPGGEGCPPTPTPTPVLCQRCLSDADCGPGFICKVCATCYQLCVRVISPNGDCNNCLNAGPIK